MSRAWRAMFSLAGTLETAFPSDDADGYLAQPGIREIGRVGEVLVVMPRRAWPPSGVLIRPPEFLANHRRPPHRARGSVKRARRCSCPARWLQDVRVGQMPAGVRDWVVRGRLCPRPMSAGP